MNYLRGDYYWRPKMFNAKVIKKLQNQIDQLRERINALSNVELLFKYAKEIEMVDTLSQQLKQGDIGRVKSILLKPILEERWRLQNIEKADKINKNLVAILEQRNKLLNDKLRMDKEGKDIKYISGQLDMLDKIIKEAQENADEKTS